MKALAFMMLILAMFVLAGTASADDVYFDEQDVEIDEGKLWDNRGRDIEIPANATFTLRVNVSAVDPDEWHNFTGIDIYLFTPDEYDNYDDGEGEEFATLSPPGWLESREGTFEWSKITEPEDVVLYLVIDNLNNTRENDAVPNRTVFMNINWSIIEREDIGPNGQEPTESDDDGDITTFLILAVIVLVVMMAIGMGVRRKGTGEDGEGPSEPEEEDYFGRMRIG